MFKLKQSRCEGHRCCGSKLQDTEDLVFKSVKTSYFKHSSDANIHQDKETTSWKNNEKQNLETMKSENKNHKKRTK